MIATNITLAKVTARLGQGGMGEVYRATGTKLDREAAIKDLPAKSSHQERRSFSQGLASGNPLPLLAALFSSKAFPMNRDRTPGR